MSLYPKWLLVLAGTNLLSLLLSVFYLFGGVAPWADSASGAVRVVGYVGVQLLWIIPVVCFFGALRAHDHGHPWLAAFIALAGIALGGLGLILLF